MGGSLVRKQATGYGCCYFMENALNAKGKTFNGSTVVISGSGNVALYATEKATQLGGKVVALSDSTGYIYDKNGIDLELMKQIKEIDRKRCSEYIKHHPDAEYHEGCLGIWNVKCDIALPCATQNELNEEAAKTLVKNGCIAIGEGANMPCTPEAVEVLHENKVIFGPGKAANAGGVATSALEMSQNSMRMSWSFEEVDDKLKDIMKHIYDASSAAAKKYGQEDNLVFGANVAGFIKVAEAMFAQGVL